MVEFGEIPPDQEVIAIPDTFVETDEATGRKFYVPEIIKVFSHRGKILGEFILHQDNGAVVEKGTGVNPTAKLGKRVIIRAGASIGNYATIGDQAFIGNHATISNDVIIGNFCTIGSMTQIERGAHIKSRVRIGSQTVIGEESYIRVNIPGFTRLDPGSRIAKTFFVRNT